MAQSAQNLAAGDISASNPQASVHPVSWDLTQQTGGYRGVGVRV